LKPAKFAGELNPIGAVGQNLRNENQITLATNQPSLPVQSITGGH
jgi:hypothetical protein